MLLHGATTPDPSPFGGSLRAQTMATRHQSQVWVPTTLWVPRSHPDALIRDFSLRAGGHVTVFGGCAYPAIRLRQARRGQAGMPTAVDRLTCEHVEAFIADQLSRWRPKRAHVR